MIRLLFPHEIACRLNSGNQFRGKNIFLFFTRGGSQNESLNLRKIQSGCILGLKIGKPVPVVAGAIKEVPHVEKDTRK